MRTQFLFLLACCAILAFTIPAQAATESEEAVPEASAKADTAEPQPAAGEQLWTPAISEESVTVDAARGCSASQYCPNRCPRFLSCTGTYSCLVGPNWIECDGNRTYCSDGPYCTTACCSHYSTCDKYCGTIAACINGCCVCEPE